MRRKPKPEIKLDFIRGLKEIVLSEINHRPDFHIIQKNKDSIYLDYRKDFDKLTNLRSILRVCIIARNPIYHPRYISNYKSILGDLINIIIEKKKKNFKNFKILCAGSDSPNVRSIAEYIKNTFKLKEKEEADLKIHIFKINKIWEVGVQITSRPLSLRDYKIKNMSGAMNPTIAYSINSLCKLNNASSYLNIFSGSATLLIEAAQCYPNLKQMIGFDNQKKSISLAIQNIKEARLIKKIQLKEKDIFNKPNLGKFDVITSDLPFGMCISKEKDLEKLYQCFVDYCQEALKSGGRLGIYTNEKRLFRKIILKSKFKIIKTLKLKFLTSINAYLRPRIFVCKLKVRKN